MRFILLLVFFILNNHTLFGQDTEMPDSVCGTFGIACSIVGHPQPSMLKTILHVNNANKDSLLRWLKSDRPQVNIHGYVGLYFMQRNGVRLSNVEREEMDIIKNSDGLVDYCSGCIFGNEGPLKELLTKKKLKMYYKWYQRFGYKDLKTFP